MFTLSAKPLEQADFNTHQQLKSCGAFIIFSGYVRNRNDDKDVKALEYEAYPDLCRVEADKIIREAKDLFLAEDVRVIHRTGRLTIGEMAIWIGVQAGHRDQAYKASRYVIDEIKKRVPVWKKEFYVDGASEWINCAMQASAKIVVREDPYSRQTSLPNWGVEGQRKLQNARVGVMGAGGLGSSVLMSLAGSGVGTIAIYDGDTLAEHNLHRQFLYNHSDVGQPKAQLAQERIQALNPSLNIVSENVFVTAHNIEDFIRDCDIILDCTDSFAAHYLINDACVLLNKPLVQASLYQFEGQVHVYDPQQGSCLRCIWPDVPQAGCVGNCTDAGVVGALPGAIGHIQAFEGIKCLLGWISRAQTHLLLYNFLDHSIQSIQRSRNKDCPLCGSSSQRMTLDYLQQNAEDIQVPVITANEVLKKSIEDYIWIDIREGYERVMLPAKDVPAQHLPMSTFNTWNFNFNSNDQYIIFCSKGVRSADIVRKLTEQGFQNCFSLDQGIGNLCEALKQQSSLGNK